MTSKSTKPLFFSLLAVLAILLIALWDRYGIIAPDEHQPEMEEGVQLSEKTQQEVSSEEDPIIVFADNLQIPWDIVFLPNGDALVTERPGTLFRIGKDSGRIRIAGVEQVGEGGLLGMVLHPNFEQNGWLYLYLTTVTEQGTQNRVERYQYTEDRLEDRMVIFEGIPGAQYHDGGRMAFGPDGYLYITTGDGNKSELAQQLDSPAGKILRLRDDGSIPSDNSYASAIYSYGHRNPQGLAWDDEGRLWSTEHGRSGILSGLDEINLIEAGANYGWPTIQGSESHEGMQTPVAHSGAKTTWAPGGLVYYDDSLFFPGLRGEALYEAVLNRDGTIGTVREHLKGEYGRLRTIQIGPDGFFYVLTSNRDGRGNPHEGDDTILRIDPTIFRQSLPLGDLIQVDLASGAQISSPLTLQGEARGPWFFEASFPVRLVDAEGKQLFIGPAQATSEWMTEDFVPFEITITFDPPSTPTGVLILQRDNPSGLPEFDQELRIPVRF